jgi:lysophospholipase L1-like esterase
VKKTFLTFILFLISLFTFAQKNNQKIIFIGNSITEMWTKKSFFFKSNTSFINKGISGQTTSEILNRFQNDVINKKPNTVIILAGINDIAENNGPIKIEKIAENIFKMVELAKKEKINTIICSVLPANKILWNKSIKPSFKIIKLNMILKQFCKNNKIEYVDYYSEMVDWKGGLKTPLYTSKWDLVHPNEKGYEKMEEILQISLKKRALN